MTAAHATGRETRRSPVLWGVGVGAVILLVVSFTQFGTHPKSTSTRRFISLSPAISATLVAIGARAQLVGVSDYCHFAVDVGSISRVGSGYTPRYEAIVALAPSAVFVEAVNAANVAQLSNVVRVEALPWLTLDDVIRSTRRMGVTTNHTSLADKLATDYARQLSSNVDPDSPRILMTVAHVPGALREVVFIRKNSIHGRVLEAAGAKNAVEEDVPEAPRLSLEQVVTRNPDGIVILESAPAADPRLVEDWRKLSVLRAVKTNQIVIIAAPDVAIPGPQLLELAKRLALAIRAWKKAA